MFTKVRWKPGVEVFEAEQRAERVLIVRLGETAVILTPENIGGFVESIDSEAKAIELATFLQQGVLFIKESDVRAFKQACHDHQVGTFKKETADPLTVRCALNEKRNAYQVSFVNYRDRNLVRANYAITADGQIIYECENLVEGPPIERGWNAPDEQFVSYIQRSEKFEKAVEQIVGRAAVTLLKEVSLNNQGMLLAREHALAWILEEPSRVKTYAQTIKQVLEEEGMSAALKQKATTELEHCSSPD